MQTLLGYTNNEMKKFSLKDITHEGVFSYDVEQFLRLIAKEIKCYTVSRIYKSKRGKLINGAITVSLIELNNEKLILGILHHSIDAYNSFDFVEKNFETIDKILTYNPDLHFIIDNSDSKLVYTNKSVLNYFGYSEKDLVNDELEIVFLRSKVDRESIKLVSDNILNVDRNEMGYFVENEFRILTKDNNWKWIKMRSIELVKNEKLNIQLKYEILQDITKTKLIEQELDSKLDLLSNKNDQLEEFISKNTELERFAYILSHDLKEPLRGIGTIAEILESEIKAMDNPKLETLTKFLIESSSRVNLMIEGILDYSKTSNNPIQRELVDINKNVNYIINDLDVLIKESNINIKINNLPKVMGSEIQIRQLFQNLINNAIKFNNSTSPYVEIGAIKLDGNITFYVKDNGIGIAQQYHESIFQMFKRLNSDTDFSGEGLGLSICKKIVERHNGKIWVENNTQDKSGTVFYFTLGLICFYKT